MPHEAYKSPDGVPVHGLVYETGSSSKNFYANCRGSSKRFCADLKRGI
jgi:hypothetical protein